jgi:hypothetical protein
MTSLKVRDFFQRHRLLDGHTGILGFYVHYKLMATYSTWVYLLSFSVTRILHLALIWHVPARIYPPITFRLKLFGRAIIDTGAEAAEKISRSVKRSSDEREAAKQQAAEKLERIGVLDLAKQYAQELY